MNEKIDCRSSLGTREMKEVDGGDEVLLIDIWETKSGWLGDDTVPRGLGPSLDRNSAIFEAYF